MRLGDAQISTEHPDPIRFPNFELAKQSSTLQDTEAQEISYAETQTHPIPYDEFLLEKARTQWQFGDWESLAKLNLEAIQHHPERAKLALLAAAGNLQTDGSNAARQYIRLAQGWGCSKRLISQILISGVHNSLGRAAILAGQHQRAVNHIESSIGIGTPHAEIRLLVRARIDCQLNELEGNTNLLQWPISENLRHLPLHPPPRLIIINGMIRSGSTVSMNIVTDLLKLASIPTVKYYISDLRGIKELDDHVKQNPSVCFVLKTHTVSEDLVIFSKATPSKYIYTKRNLLEVAASYIRMSGNSESPFYKKSPLVLADILKILKNQVVEYKKTLTLENCLIIDCSDFNDSELKKTISTIAKHLGINIDMNTLEKVNKDRAQSSHALYSSRIEDSSLTSLGHESNSFFHKGHVIEGGTTVEDYLPTEWIYSILTEYSDSVDDHGNLI